MNKFARMLITDSRQGMRRDYNEDYARGRGMDYAEDYARGRDRADYGMDYARGGRDRNDYGYDMAKGRRYRADYGEDYGDYARGGDRASYNDYGKPKLFSHKDIETWKSMMKNEDGTRGAHFRPEQVKHACQQAGIDCEEFGEDVFGLAMNMKYSDTCKVAKKYGVDTPEFYADMAKAFLRDKDFDGTPEEKLYIYYKGIVERDD